MVLLWLVFFVGCKPNTPGEGVGENPTVTFPELSNHLVGEDQRLPQATIEKPYEGALLISGGTPPYRWTLPPFETLPGGLELDPAGTITGVPFEAGLFEFQLLIEDSVGRSKFLFATLDARLEPNILHCGESYEGEFNSDNLDYSANPFQRFTTYDWFSVRPDPTTTRVELLFETDNAINTYLERPAQKEGSLNLEDHYYSVYLNPDYSDMFYSVDASTTPSLPAYGPNPILPMYVSSGLTGPYAVTVQCSESPIFKSTLNYPIEVGTELAIDYDIYGPAVAVRIWTDDELPEWMNWNEETGEITGTALEAGVWEFTVKVEDENGNIREEKSIIPIYEVIDISCDERVIVEVEEGYYDGEYTSLYDPKGWQVYRLPLPEGGLSGIDASLDQGDSHLLGFAAPGADYWKFYMEDRAYGYQARAFLSVSPTTYPDIEKYTDAGEVYLIAASTGMQRTMELSVSCRQDVQADFPAIPVFEPFIQGNYQLDALGGVPPYSWAALGLPDGVTLSNDGVLSGVAFLPGTFEVEISISDTENNTFTSSYPMYVGVEEACAGYTPMSCDQTAQGTFYSSYFSDNSGQNSTEVLCMVYNVDNTLGYVVNAYDADLRMDIADPGATAREMFDEERGTYMGYAWRDSSEGVALNPWDLPNSNDYQNLPILFSVRASDPGSWSASLTCFPY